MLPDVTDSFLDSLPSERYLAVMIEGAIQHGLPKYWIEACPLCTRRLNCLMIMPFTLQ